jgi:hypothetical protein
MCFLIYTEVRSRTHQHTQARVLSSRALMQARYAWHVLQCLECRVVDKCSSNVLRSLNAYRVRGKSVHTRVRRRQHRPLLQLVFAHIQRHTDMHASTLQS